MTSAKSHKIKPRKKSDVQLTVIEGKKIKRKIGPLLESPIFSLKNLSNSISSRDSV